MNALTLLSGWSQPRDQQIAYGSQRSRQGSLSSGGHAGSSQRGRQDRQDKTEPVQEEVGELGSVDQHDTYTRSLLDALSVPTIQGNSFDNVMEEPSSRSTAAGGPKSDLAHLPKPPEAIAYEDTEALSSSTGPLPSPSLLYPTPAQSRTPTPINAIDEASRQDIDGFIPSVSEEASPSAPSLLTRTSRRLPRWRSSLQSHDAARLPQPPRNLSERHTRFLARSYPVRCITRIYMLLRRFFALFGVDLQPVATSLSRGPPAPALTAPIVATISNGTVADAPPSYQDAIKLLSPTPVQVPSSGKAPRWRVDRLIRRDKSTNSINEKDSLAGTESDVGMEEEKSGSLGPDIQSSEPHAVHPRSRVHLKPPSFKASVAQLALSKPKLLVLDLDETLIHSTSRMSYASNAVTSSIDGSSRSAWNANTSGLKVRVVEVVLDGRSVIYHVYKRPWVDFFLRKVSAWYTVVIFTASLQEYADPVIDWLDQGRGMISTRLFRESCTFVNGSYLKDLSIVDKDLARVCLVDNSPISYAINPGKQVDLIRT
jgi:Dullard-like phosphatase family protein